MTRQKRRLIFRSGLVIILGVMALIAALPLWWPWLLRPAAKHLGISYDGYERDGYNHFRLHGVTFTNHAGRFEAKQVQAFVPTVWLWKLGADETNSTFCEINSWEFVSQSKSNETKMTSVYTNFVTLQKTLGLLNRFLPRASLTNGTVRITGTVLDVPQAAWVQNQLTAVVILPNQMRVDLQGEYRDANSLRVSLASAAVDARSSFAVTNAISALEIQGAATWMSNRMELDAAFQRSGLLPENASLRADEFEIPAAMLRLQGYKNPTGSLRARWSTNQFNLDLTARALPESAAMTEIDVEAHASGDTHSARIDAAKIALPWLNAELSAATVVEFTPPFLPHPAQMRVTADLAKQSRWDITGKVMGTATAFPSSNKYPRIEFQLTGNELAVSNLQTQALELEGEFNWPQLTIASASVNLSGDSAARIGGVVNLAEKTVERGRLSFSGTLGNAFLPASISFTNAELQSNFSGPFTALNHSGKIKVEGLHIPNFKLLSLAGEWKGRNANILQVKLNANAGAASMTMMGSVNAATATKTLMLSALTLRTSNGNAMTLEKPFQVTFQHAENSAATNLWWVECQPFKWQGAGPELAIAGSAHWPEWGNFQVTAQNLDSGLFQDFITATNVDAVLEGLSLKGGWTNGPVTFALESSAKVRLDSGYAFSAETKMVGGSNGLSLAQLTINATTQVVCHAEGFLPFILWPSASNDVVQLQPDGLLQLRAFTETNAAFWNDLVARTPLRLANPRLSVNVTGTWVKPQGEARATVDRIEFKLAKPLPAVDDLNFNLRMNRDTAVSHLDASVLGQPISAQAEIPLGQGFWNGFDRQRALPDLRAATGTMTIQSAQIAPFVEFAPHLLSPQGELNLNLKLEPNYQLSGKATLYHAATRPLPSVGPVRSIDLEILFAGDEAILTNAVAEIGGQRIHAAGRTRLEESFWRKREMPSFEVRLIGTNVPLVRQAGVLVRADLNLGITNASAGIPTIRGLVRLRDSFLLSGLKDLAPGKVTSTKRRPPYFSIEAEPWAAWHLALQVEGEKFLKVQSPIFNGVASTTLQLEGTLKEPLALGEVRINSGAVTFPFGSLGVQQGFITLTSGNLYHPQLFVNASAQRVGYDLKLEVTGPADQPILQFSSNPPLTSEQIILMLTTGQTPQGIAGNNTRQRAQGVAMFVGQSLLTDIGIGGSGEDRLTVRSGEQLTEAGRPTYDVEYKLADDWAVIGEYDRFSQYNLGLKWRVYTK